MKLTEITVSHGETVPRKRVKFANWKPGVRLTATLDPTESVIEAYANLRNMALNIIEEEKGRLLKVEKAMNDLRNANYILKKYSPESNQYKDASADHELILETLKQCSVIRLDDESLHWYPLERDNEL